MNLASVVIGIFVLVYAALIVIAMRRPLLARLALREAVRRPWQSAVVVLGLMVGTVSKLEIDSASLAVTVGLIYLWVLVVTIPPGCAPPACRPSKPYVWRTEQRSLTCPT